MAGKKGMRRYPMWLRQEVVRKRVKEGQMTLQLCEEYGISATQVKNWCQWQRQYGEPKQNTGKRIGRPREGTEETLEQKVKRLEMENALLKKYHELLMEEETKRK